MTDMTEITERLHLERDALTTSDVEAGLIGVRRIVRRRRRQKAALGAAGVSGLLVVGIGAASAIDSGNTQVIVTDTAPAVTTETETSVPPETATSTAPQTTAPAPTGPSVGETLTGQTISVDPAPVTADFLAAVGDDFSVGWQVPWNDGFLVGDNASPESAAEAFFSPDGRSWEPVEFDPGLFGPAHDGVVVADGRLAVLGALGEVGSPDAVGVTRPAIAHTGDLIDWSIQEIDVEPPPPDLPSIVRWFTWPQTITANADGWLAVIETSVSLDSMEFVEQRTGTTPTGLSEERSDEGIVITVNPDTEDAPEEIRLSWAELEAEVGAELTARIRQPFANEVWTGTWDGSAPEQIVDPRSVELLSSLERPVAVDSGFVVIERTREFPDDGAPIDSTQLFANIDGSGWTAYDTPIAEQVQATFPLDGDLGVVAQADDDTISVYRVDVGSQTWTPVDIPGLPPTASYVETSATATLAINAAPEQPIDLGPFTETIEKDGYRLTTSYELYTSSYELVDVETGEVVVAESIDLREVDGSLETAFEYLIGGLVDTTLIDPETGDVLVEITAAERAAANPQEPSFAPKPEPWIVATDDGVSWFVYEVPPGDPDQQAFWQETYTVSGGQLLYRNDSREWFVVDLT